jgi:cytochrome c553
VELKPLIIVSFYLVCILSSLTYASTDLGGVIANTGTPSGAPCAVCHGAQGEGNSAAGFPRLAGLSQGYLVKQLNDYIAGRRISPVMFPNVKELTPEQVEKVAIYYANLPVSNMQSQGDDPLGIGKTLVEKGDWSRYLPPCGTCHGMDSGGVGASFPALAGQHEVYLVQQLQSWKKGTRHNDPLGLMSSIAKRLSDEQIQALAHYLASLPAPETDVESLVNE